MDCGSAHGDQGGVAKWCGGTALTGLRRGLCSQAEGTGHVRLSKSIYNFTERQDVRLSVGYRGVVDEQGNFKGVRRAHPPPPPPPSARSC